MMRRSFGGGGRGMGGGGGGSSGGSGMLRAVQRAVRTGGTVSGAAQEPFSHSTTTAKTTRTATSTTSHAFNNKANTTLSLSSLSPLSTLNNQLPLSATAFAPAWDSSTYNTDESEDWECLEECEDERVNILFDDYILGTVPSTDEVHNAVSALQRVLEPSHFSYSTNDGLGYNSNEDKTDELTSSINLMREVSSSGSMSDWIEPSMHICNSKLIQSYGANQLFDAFHLLQTEPSIQKMVISLSSDKAVWDAVLNNEAVREIRDSLKQADNGLPAGSSEEGFDKSDRSDGTIDIISWIVVNTKEKVMEIVEKIIEFVNEWFQPPEEEKTSEGNSDPFDKKLRTSFFLSVVVLLVVVVARAQCA
ncbi:uncharacterized protein LOC107778812 isoform X2 [Nicotiana tabacum]|uniref:Uncharacterized protein LOC107778812 isoform X2 n=2 Tax=Nicotiana TaxID=4085 RepID=A0A1S3YRC4_TOBAC|nr:PREDICTED: uncharacterized protein LOC104247814 isoform X2 [Nicotiana sylvestris]XP_016454607.1 PREDICTED: uncharacterized protein LOC107778812 isoform X2 [Nicotiana tabacum]